MANSTRILVITPRFPYPLYGGDLLRIYHICRYLSRYYDLSLLSICQTPEEQESQMNQGIFTEIRKIPLHTWRSYLQSIGGFLTGRSLQTAYYSSGSFRRTFRELYPDFDLVLVHLARLAQYVEELSDKPVLLELTDSLALNYYRAKDIEDNGLFSLRRAVYSLEAPRILRYEKSLLKQFNAISLVSETDKSFLASRGADVGGVQVIPNGVDTESLQYLGPGDESRIVFIGNMRTLQNQDACRYFISQILPEVRKRLGEVDFKIIGNESDRFVSHLNAEGSVSATGRVESIAPEVQGAFCAVAVMRFGAGMQNKVLEYMAYGIPVIANDIAMQGIGAEPDTHYLSGNSPEDVVEQIVSLYSARARRKELARQARGFVEQNFRWEHYLHEYKQLVEELL